MYERLIPEVISTFADAGEDERCFLTRLRTADIQPVSYTHLTLPTKA